jgi:TolB-like protein/Tfp pilus assembly protein PilF
VSDRQDESDSVLRRIAAAPAKAPSPHSLAARWKPGAILVDRYRIVDERGRGGMGRVFAARDLRLDRDVAIKILLAEASDPKALQRFEQEARAASRINHPHIATVYDIVTTDDGPAIVSELLAGETLRDRLSASGPSSPEEVRGFGLQLTEGLAAAHDTGVVHRDLKPSNLFVTRDGRLKILDFGLAKLVEIDGKAPATQEGVAPGTVGYMSPEQVRATAVDARSDLFAVGIVLYELATGRRPFDGDSRHEVESRIVGQDPEPLPSAVPGWLAACILRCLEKAPERRFQSARELTAALERRDGVAIVAAPRPRRRVMGALVVAAAAGLVLALGADRLAHRAPPITPPTASRSSIAVLAFRDLSPEKGQDFLSDGIAEDVLTALARVDGLHVAGRTSSFSFRDSKDDARTIGLKLGVDTLLEGSVRRVGERVRISARLVNAADGYQVWAQDFDRGTGDILAVEDELARDIVTALKVKLVSGGRSVASRRVSKSADAYTDYLLARQQSDKGDVLEARRSIERALARDPRFAAGWAEYAGILFGIVFNTDINRAGGLEMMKEAAKAADKAIALDPELPDGYLARAAIRSDGGAWDLQGARADVDRAQALSPNDTKTLGAKAHLLLYFSHHPEQAIEPFKRIAELEPLHAGAWFMLGYAYRNSRRFTEERAALTRVLAIDPKNDMALYFLGELELHGGHAQKALAMFDTIGHPLDGFRRAGRVLALEALGRHAEAQAALAEHVKLDGKEAPLFVGNTVAQLGDVDRAIAYYEDAFAHHDVSVIDIIGSPYIDNVRRDPRYAALLHRMHLIDED